MDNCDDELDYEWTDQGKGYLGNGRYAGYTPEGNGIAEVRLESRAVAHYIRVNMARAKDVCNTWIVLGIIQRGIMFHEHTTTTLTNVRSTTNG